MFALVARESLDSSPYSPCRLWPCSSSVVKRPAGVQGESMSLLFLVGSDPSATPGSRSGPRRGMTGLRKPPPPVSRGLQGGESFLFVGRVEACNTGPNNENVGVLDGFVGLMDRSVGGECGRYKQFTPMICPNLVLLKVYQ